MRLPWRPDCVLGEWDKSFESEFEFAPLFFSILLQAGTTERRVPEHQIATRVNSKSSRTESKHRERSLKKTRGVYRPTSLNGNARLGRYIAKHRSLEEIPHLISCLHLWHSETKKAVHSGLRVICLLPNRMT
jgi:hypothetical protein